MACLGGGGMSNILHIVTSQPFYWDTGADEVFFYELLRILAHDSRATLSNVTGTELFDEATAQQSEFDQSVHR